MTAVLVLDLFAYLGYSSIDLGSVSSVKRKPWEARAFSVPVALIFARTGEPFLGMLDSESSLILATSLFLLISLRRMCALAILMLPLNDYTGLWLLPGLADISLELTIGLASVIEVESICLEF